MNTKQKNKIISVYKDLLFFYFKHDRKELYLDDKPFLNLLELLRPTLLKNEFYGDDLFISSVEWYLEKLNTLPDHVDEQQLNNLIEYINKNFEINKEKHYLIFPLQGSGLKSDISFSRFHLIKKTNETKLYEQIANITAIDKNGVKNLLDHTKKSRSKDFLQSNMMMIELENQTTNIKISAYQAAQDSINFLHLIHAAFGMESSIFRKASSFEDNNRHVAILSKDTWRCGHGHSWLSYLECKLDIDFMKKNKYQQIFNKLFNSFTLGNKKVSIVFKNVPNFL